jgi:predicted phage terminase large subunit-like protein
MEGTLDPAAISWLASDKALIEIDRELVKRGGLRAFVELAWHIIEPAAPFSPNWHIDEMCRELEATISGENRRLALALPPRHGKSSILAVFFPVYVWMKNPSARMIFISYDFSLSTRDSDRTRDLINSPWFKQRWGDLFRLTTDNITILKTSKTGYRECASTGGRIMGKGGDYVIMDDPHSPEDVESPVKREAVLRYWRESVQSRLNDPKTGRFIVCHQRVGEGDVIGDILKRQRQAYRYVCLPGRFDPKHPNIWHGDPRTEAGELLWPDHFPDSALTDLEANMGPYAAASQIQQLPAPREGGLFKKHWFPKISLAELPADLEYCRGWDFAATEKKITKADPDWTATVKIGHSFTTKKWYIVHAERWRVEGGEVNRILEATAKADVKEHGNRIRYRLPQDPGAAGKTLAQTHATLIACLSFMIEPATGDKAVNAAPLAGQAMIGNVLMLDAPWNDDFITEYTGFPTGSHDDQVDAGSQAFKGFIVGNTGILDYYTRKLEEQKKAHASLGPQPLAGVTNEHTENLAKALIR